jgi:hypothetical protein
VCWSLHFGEKRVTVKNDGQVPVRQVRLALSLGSGVLPDLLQQDLNERFPVSVLTQGEERYIRIERIPFGHKYHTRVEWSTDSGTFYMEANEGDLHSYQTPVKPVQES